MSHIKSLVISEKDRVACIYKSNKIITDLLIQNGNYQIGDIYIGVISKILLGINAAFIVLDNYDSSGFIHFNDLENLKRIKNTNNVIKILQFKSPIMVQILKEANNNKVPSLTGEITLRGRYLNIIPFNESISYKVRSKKNSDLQYLKAILYLIKPSHVGISIKTLSIFVKLEFVIQDLYSLIHDWDVICKKQNNLVPPCLISNRKNFVYQILRKFYHNNIKNIVVDSYKAAKQTALLVNQWSNISNTSIQYFNCSNFFVSHYHLDLVIYDLLQPRVNLVGGGYIIIEKTEALTIIDVNSGSFNHSDNPRDTILLVNQKAAQQIAKHLRLRNISGLVIIDFIDMFSQEDQHNLLTYFNSLLQCDTEKAKIIQFSELGLVELTRQRQGQNLLDIFKSSRKKILSLFEQKESLRANAFNYLVQSLSLNTVLVSSNKA